MPNWCENQLTVTGATPELRAYLKDHGFSFEKINPPVKPEGTSDDWMSIHANNAAWGTKWDLDENDQRRVSDELIETGIAFFDTAWSPPLEVLEALSKRFSNDSFGLAYCELGMNFAGTSTFRGGMSHDVPVEGGEAMKIAREVFGYDEPDSDSTEESQEPAARAQAAV